MSAEWRDYQLFLGMPHLVVGKASEVELLKHLGALQWRTVAAIAGAPENAVLSESDERLYFSMISVELGMGQGRRWEDFDEGTVLHLRHRIGVFGRKLVEGYFLFDAEPVPEAELADIAGPDDLRRSRRPYAYLTHGFITRGGASFLRLETPRAFLEGELPQLSQRPQGIAEQMRAERGEPAAGLAEWAEALPLAATLDRPIEYLAQPESDANALGQVYCARFAAIMNYGIRNLLRRRLAPSLSAPLCACLSTESRRLYYFANAEPHERLELHIETRLLPAPPGQVGRMRTLGWLLSRIDLHRGSDGVIMGSSEVKQALVVPGREKAVLTEAERLFRRLGLSAP